MVRHLLISSQLPIDRSVDVNPRESIDQLINAYEFTELSGHVEHTERCVSCTFHLITKSAIAISIDRPKRYAGPQSMYLMYLVYKPKAFYFLHFFFPSLKLAI
jgi:hypothetical protein